MDTPKKESRIIARNRKLWLQEGLRLLVDRGAASLSIKQIAGNLGTSRSPFFRVFGDRENYYRQLFDHYYETKTEYLIRITREFGGTPWQRLWFLSRKVVELELLQYDFAFRQWSLANQQIGDAIYAMDEDRMAYIRTLFSEMGFTDQEAKHRTMLIYCEYIGYLVSGRIKAPPNHVQERLAMRFYLYTAPPMPQDYALPTL